jgi:hypothetical protein
MSHALHWAGDDRLLITEKCRYDRAVMVEMYAYSWVSDVSFDTVPVCAGAPSQKYSSICSPNDWNASKLILLVPI